MLVDLGPQITARRRITQVCTDCQPYATNSSELSQILPILAPISTK